MFKNESNAAMKSHAPKNYICPICLGVNGIENNETLIRKTDLVYKDNLVTVFISSFFVGKNAGHVIIVPNKHFETIYDIPNSYGHRIFDITQKMAAIIKHSYRCDGITIRQNNEPAGDQRAFHFHLHVFPRYTNDNFNEQKPSDKFLAEPSERQEFAKKLNLAIKNG
jgi:histidine triad (HIT) family protein